MGAYSPNIIANSFISCATHNAEGEIIVYGDKRITWSQLVPRVRRLAKKYFRADSRTIVTLEQGADVKGDE